MERVACEQRGPEAEKDERSKVVRKKAHAAVQAECPRCSGSVVSGAVCVAVPGHVALHCTALRLGDGRATEGFRGLLGRKPRGGPLL